MTLEGKGRREGRKESERREERRKRKLRVVRQWRGRGGKQWGKGEAVSGESGWGEEGGRKEEERAVSGEAGGGRRQVVRLTGVSCLLLYSVVCLSLSVLPAMCNCDTI